MRLPLKPFFAMLHKRGAKEQGKVHDLSKLALVSRAVVWLARYDTAQAICIVRAQHLPTTQLNSKLVLLEENPALCEPLIADMAEFFARVDNLPRATIAPADGAVADQLSVQQPALSIGVSMHDLATACQDRVRPEAMATWRHGICSAATLSASTSPRP